MPAVITRKVWRGRDRARLRRMKRYCDAMLARPPITKHGSAWLSVGERFAIEGVRGIMQDHLSLVYQVQGP